MKLRIDLTAWVVTAFLCTIVTHPQSALAKTGATDPMPGTSKGGGKSGGSGGGESRLPLGVGLASVVVTDASGVVVFTGN